MSLNPSYTNIIAKFDNCVYPYNGTCNINNSINEWIIDIPNETWAWTIPSKKKYRLRNMDEIIIYINE